MFIVHTRVRGLKYFVSQTLLIILQIQHLPCLVVHVFQKKRFHLLYFTSSLLLAIGVVQLHTDLTDVLTLPVQPEHLVTELADAFGESFKLRLVLVVDLLHLLLYVLEVWGHVALHAARDTGVHVIHCS